MRAAVNATLKKSLSVGRVQTPTLALVVRREMEIRNFKPVAYYVPSCLADGRVLSWSSRKEGGGMRGIDGEGRIIDGAVAEAIVSAIQSGMDGVVSRYDSIERNRHPHALQSGELQSKCPQNMACRPRKHPPPRSRFIETRWCRPCIGTDCRYLQSPCTPKPRMF
ncbi:DNA topoisomerase [Cupriavidus basilensis]